MSWQSDTWASLLTVHRGARCQLVTWQLNEWRRDAPHTRARSASVSGGPRARERCGARLGVSTARRGCYGVGAASNGAGRRGASLRRAVGVCALAPAACALLRRLSGRLRRAGAGWARLARGSIRSGKPLRGVAAWVPVLNCPILTGALRVDCRRSARLVKGAARVWGVPAARCGCYGSARRWTARGGAGALPASGLHLCTGSRGSRAGALALGTLAPGWGGLDAAGAVLLAPWEGFAHRCEASATCASELP